MSPHLEIWKFLLLVSEIAENFVSGTRSPGLWNLESHFRIGSKIKFHWQRLESSTWDPESTSLYPESKTVLDSLPSAPETFHAWFPVSVKTSVGTDASRCTRFPNMAPNTLYVWIFADCFTSRPCPHESATFSFRIQKFPRAQVSGFTLVPRTPLGILATGHASRLPGLTR